MTKLPLKEVTINQLCNGADATVYEIPIYQRNYAWEKDEITTLVQDIYDAYKKNSSKYFIGTLVSFHKGDGVYEVIDGQQRLTTINIIMNVLQQNVKNKLTYRARKKSNITIQSMPQFNALEEKDLGIINGHKYASAAVDEIVPGNEKAGFISFFKNHVSIIHYRVPKDIDLNHYFEIMNSRGEQLEKHEIIKARLISVLNYGDTEEAKEQSRIDREKLNYIWESCSLMNVYIQQKSKNTSIFGNDLSEFIVSNFEEIVLEGFEGEGQSRSIEDMLNNDDFNARKVDSGQVDTFQPVINFANFLLIVLKITRIMEEDNFNPYEFNLDDKELIHEFDKLDDKLVKIYAYNLLKAKYYLDNYIVHHSNEDDTTGNNPWMLERWQKDGKTGYKKNLAEGNELLQLKLVHLLSMFEVSFTARQRKNYLFYCLLYLFREDTVDVTKYCEFVKQLAEKYFKDVYLVADALNERNTPKPGSFDTAIINQGKINVIPNNMNLDFKFIYGDGTLITRGIPLFVFNLLDYKIWEKYADELRGEKTKRNSVERKAFFNDLGCSDFGLDIFRAFYFSRTRRSLEHYYPQANIELDGATLDANKINCFGNFAMIGSEANSAGSNWSPKVKLDHYLDASRKIAPMSVASLKFMIMMQMCRDNEHSRDLGDEWNFEDIKLHQEKMLKILL